METENKVVFAAIIATLAALFAMITGISYNDNEAVVKMVQAGAHPLDARCAVSGGSSNVCALRAVKHG